MMRVILMVAGVAFVGCSGSEPKSGTGGTSAAPKASKAMYICYMGADCGKSEVKAGDAIPSCCGKVMTKADTYTCACGKPQFIPAGKPAPECCGAKMKKALP